MNNVIKAPDIPRVLVNNGDFYPVRRIFCVGKNYADHVVEMGGDLKSSKPVFFTKPADAVVPDGGKIPYPQATENLHYEGELVVALKSGGKNISSEKANDHIYGYAAGCDLTRRDLQTIAKNSGNPWDIAKGFDHSAPIAAIVPVNELKEFDQSILSLSVNGNIRQQAPLSLMIWSIAEIIETLSSMFELKAGDLIFTGTPEGVGALSTGDQVRVEIGTLPALEFEISR